MFTGEDMVEIAITLIAASGVCLAVPGFWQRLEVARAELRDDPKKKEAMPVFIARAPKAARYFLVTGITAGFVAIFLFVKNA